MFLLVTPYGRFAFISSGLTFVTNMTGMYRLGIEPATSGLQANTLSIRLPWLVVFMKMFSLCCLKIMST